MKNIYKSKKKQNGLALLIMVIVIFLAISSYYFSTISIVEIQVNNIEKTRKVLKQAKAALISYAVTHVDGNGSGVAGEYGYLPCPDSSAVSTEGNQDPACGGFFKNRLGYLPWKSLDLPALKDGSGNCLWYAISGSYKGENISPLPQKFYTGLINEDTTGLFQVVDGIDEVVAIVFAPGVPLAGQARVIDANTHCGENYGNQIAYLEGDGVTNNSNVPDIVDSPDQFIHATATSAQEAVPYNDYFITITREEIWQAVKRRGDLNNHLREVTEALAMCLANYVNGNVNKRFPLPALMNIDSGDYRMMDAYRDDVSVPQNYAGRFPFYLDESNVLLGLAANNITTMGFCNNLILSSGVIVDLEPPASPPASEHQIILNNWKDHFFYSVSKDYALPNVLHTGCIGDCISVEDPVGVFTDQAAIVFFSGNPYSVLNQTRANADKSDISNYLENGNDAQFPDVGGDGVYTATNPDPLVSNDYMFCLSDNATPAVIACSP
jgi:hypothetical protein